MQLFRIWNIQAADDHAVHSRAAVSRQVFGDTALAAAVERRHDKALSGIAQLAGPIAAIAGVAMELKHSGRLTFQITGL